MLPTCCIMTLWHGARASSTGVDSVSLAHLFYFSLFLSFSSFSSSFSSTIFFYTNTPKRWRRPVFASSSANSPTFRLFFFSLYMYTSTSRCFFFYLPLFMLVRKRGICCPSERLALAQIDYYISFHPFPAEVLAFHLITEWLLFLLTCRLKRILSRDVVLHLQSAVVLNDGLPSSISKRARASHYGSATTRNQLCWTERVHDNIVRSSSCFFYLGFLTALTVWKQRNASFSWLVPIRRIPRQRPRDNFLTWCGGRPLDFFFYFIF